MNDDAVPPLPPAAASARANARALHARGDLAGALQRYRQADSLAPGHPDILGDFARLAADAGDWPAVERVLRPLEARYPGRNAARFALSLMHTGRYDEALPRLKALVERGDTDIACVIAYSACLERTGDVDGAIGILEQLYRALPIEKHAVLLNSLLMRTGRYDLVRTRLPALLADHPDNAQLLSAVSEDALCRRDYARGFDLAHHRWAIALEPRKADRLPCPDWDGTPFVGTLLVTCEQGLGDEILASSLFTELDRLGQRCLIDAEPRLLPVFRRSFPSLAFTDRKGEALVDAARAGDCRKAEALELARFWRRDAANFPPRRSWLEPDATRRDALRAKLRAAHPGKRLVGISWRSARAFLADAKSIPLPDLAPLLALPDTVWVNLQYGDTRAETDALRTATGISLVDVADVDNTQDIDGLFALADALDAVVSSSNTTVHVAGALGKPVYAMIPGARYVLWYWGYEGDHSPWYPSLRLFRGPTRKSWAALAADVALQLSQEVSLP